MWTASHLLSHPTYNAATKRWNVTVDHAGVTVELHPAHIVMSTGPYGPPSIPQLRDEHVFKGISFHASAYVDGRPFAGKDVVIVGAGNTAIDICQDLVTRGAKTVTMVQRSSTCVVSGDRVGRELANKWPDGVPIEISDFKGMTMPFGLLKTIQQSRVAASWAEEAELHQGLLKAGLKLDMGPENEGIVILPYSRGGGMSPSCGSFAVFDHLHI